MLIYSVTETVVLLAGYNSIVVLEMSVPQTLKLPPPKLTILTTCMGLPYVFPYVITFCHPTYELSDAAPHAFSH